MSRVGKLAIAVPSGVKVELNNEKIVVSGKQGTLENRSLQGVRVQYKENTVLVEPIDETKKSRAMWGTVRNNIFNMVKGVSEGFTQLLDVNGVGYRAAVKGQILTLTLGYSHEIKYAIPQGISIKVNQNVEIEITGSSKQLVGQVAAEIMRFRPFEPYKGKGVFKKGKPGRRKEGKKK